MAEPHAIQPDDTPVQPTVAAPRYPQCGRRPAQGLQRPRYALAAAFLAAAPPDFLHLANAVINPITGESQEYHKLIKGPKRDVWIRAFANDLGRLAQGVGTRMPKGNNTIFFIGKNQVPTDHIVTYDCIVAKEKPNKSEFHCVCLTVGGNCLNFPGITATQCAILTTSKCLFDSTISTRDVRFVCLDIGNF